MKSIRFRLLIAAAAVLLGTAIANSQTVTAERSPAARALTTAWQRPLHARGIFFPEPSTSPMTRNPR